MARGGQLKPEDVFHYERDLQVMLGNNAREMYSELERVPGFANWRQAFSDAVHGTGDPTAPLRAQGMSEAAINAELQRLQQWDAELNLAHIRERNRATIAWILAEGSEARVKENMRSDVLLLNRHSIETIGPAILNMVVSDQEWSKLTPQEQAKKIPMSELAVKDMAELRSIALSDKVVSLVSRRTNTHLVLEKALAHVNKPLTYLSASVRSLSAETGGKGYDLLDFYADAIDHPARDVYNLKPIDKSARKPAAAAAPPRPAGKKCGPQDLFQIVKSMI